MNLSPEERKRRSDWLKSVKARPDYAEKTFSKEAQERRVAANERKRRFNELARYMMEAPISSEDELLEELTLHGFTQADYQSAVFWGQLKKAIYGMDTEAAKFVRDTAGFKPTEQLQVGNLDDQPFETLDLSKLTNEQLREMVAKRTNYEDD